MYVKLSAAVPAQAIPLRTKSMSVTGNAHLVIWRISGYKE
jgi:hypothetical protein